jgi:hypothetical protein
MRDIQGMNSSQRGGFEFHPIHNLQERIKSYWRSDKTKERTLHLYGQQLGGGK